VLTFRGFGMPLSSRGFSRRICIRSVLQAELSEVVDDEAVIMLFGHYRTTDGMTIRRALTLAKSSAEEAWDSDADRVRIGHVHSAMADLA